MVDFGLKREKDTSRVKRASLSNTWRREATLDAKIDSRANAWIRLGHTKHSTDRSKCMRGKKKKEPLNRTRKIGAQSAPDIKRSQHGAPSTKNAWMDADRKKKGQAT